MPHFRDDRVHDAMNDAAVSMAGFRIVARQSLDVSKDMIADPSNTLRINEGVERMRVLMTETARRADR